MQHTVDFVHGNASLYLQFQIYSLCIGFCGTNHLAISCMSLKLQQTALPQAFGRIRNLFIMNLKQPHTHKKTLTSSKQPTNNHHNKTAWPLLNYQVPRVLVYNLIHSFLLLPCTEESKGGGWGVVERVNTPTALLSDLVWVQGPRRTWGDWFPGEEMWQFHLPGNDKAHFMPFKALRCVQLHLTFTLGISGRGGLFFLTWSKSKLNIEESVRVHRVRRRLLMSWQVAWGSCWATLLAQVLVWICEVGLYWGKYTHGKNSEYWRWKGSEPIGKEKNLQHLRSLFLRRPGGGSWMIWHRF